MSKSLIPPRREIKTSALDYQRVAEVREQLHRIDQIKSAKIKRDVGAPAAKGDIEDVPLETLDSMVGYQAQGDSYRNDLDTLYERIINEAPAPRYVSSEQSQKVRSPERSTLSDPFDTLSNAEGLDTIDNFDPLDTLDLTLDESLS